MENQISQTPTVDSSQATVVQGIDQKPKKNNFLVILLSLLLFIAVTIAGFFAYQTQKLVKELQKIRREELVTPTPLVFVEPTTDPTSSWKTYTNEKYGFSIKYPETWRLIESDNFVGFGPKEVSEDVLWGVNIFSKSTTTFEQIEKKSGSQFSDRKQTFDLVTYGPDGTGTKLITTTVSIPDWYSVEVVYQSNDNFYVISNGAISDTKLPLMKGVPQGITFEDFYSTFRFTN